MCEPLKGLQACLRSSWPVELCSRVYQLRMYVRQLPARCWNVCASNLSASPFQPVQTGHAHIRSVCSCSGNMNACGVCALHVQLTRLMICIVSQMSAMQLASPSYCWFYMLVRCSS